MIQITSLIDAANAFCEAASIPETALSSRMFNDAKKLTALRNGAGITVARYNAALVWLYQNWPENTARHAALDGADAAE